MIGNRRVRSIPQTMRAEARSQINLSHTQKEEMQVLKLSRMSQMTKILGAIAMSALLLWAT